MRDYLAHYDKESGDKQLLNIHLSSVAKLINELIPPTVEFDYIKNPTIKKICYWLGYFHDIGKYSDFFQQYIKEDKDSRLKNHAHISACFTYSFLLDQLPELEIETGIGKNILFLCYLCVRLHHTSLRMDVSLFQDNVWNDLDKIKKHLELKSNEILEDMSLSKEISYEKFCSYLDINKLQKNKQCFELMPIQYKNGRISDHKWYFLLIYLFSVLIDMDKLDAAEVKPKKVVSVTPDNVILYLDEKNKGETVTNLDNRREKARNTMMQVINNLTNEEIKKSNFFTLTAPTGIGKTLSSLQCALRLQERIESNEKYTPRIITAIPFINIIEQNKEEYQNVCGKDARIIVHHRLSDFSDRKNYPISEYLPVDKTLLETESWEGDVIITTFVQLFQSLFTGKNKALKKINKLAGSILILDEVQSIPEDYKPLIGATLKMLSKYYGTRFILMTATQPKLLEFGDMLLMKQGILKNDDKTIELLPDHEKYFECLNRTKLVSLLNKRLDENDFINLFFEKWERKKSCLIVVNTIKRSINLYEKIKKELNQRNIAVNVYYLSTNIIPLKRKEVIEKVGDLLYNGKPVILVSTQTIEAGVDMDFDMAFRDFAPLDSIIQTAGRVNREGKKGIFLPVYIIQLENDNHYVYNLSHRESTLRILTDKNEFMETEYGGLVERYYNLALKRDVSDKSRIIWEDGIMKFDFEVLKSFSLIQDIGEVYDVFVEKDSATDLANAYESLINYKDRIKYDLSKLLPVDISIGQKLNIYERKALLRIILAKMSDYIIQVRISRLKENKPIPFKNRGNADSDLFWIPPGQLEQYYNDNTGFKDKFGKALIY